MTERRYVSLDPAKTSAIVELAEAVADEFCPTGNVDPATIIKKSGITSVFNDYGESFDGMLEHLNGKFCIYCNLGTVEKPNSGRARFTLAHELGHYFMDDHRNALASGKAPKHHSRCEFQSNEEVEQEADLFASHLLLPTMRFQKKAREGKGGMSSIMLAADYFQASLTSTSIRYVKSNFMPSVLIKWKPDGTYHWKHLSEQIVKARFLKTIEDSKKIAPGSATHKVMQGETPSNGSFFENGTTAAAWFPFLNDDSYRNALFMEQAVSLGRFGYLTLLYPCDGGLPN